jgi:N-acetylmuramic acid 6-phosphate etherase
MSQPLNGRHPPLDDLPTEARIPGGADLDLLPTRELVELMAREDAVVPAAVAAAATEIAAAVDAIAERMRRGGRLVYVGAGTSGGLAALDAAECQATFATPPEQVVALVAGGADGTPAGWAAAEDDAAAGKREAAALGLGPEDSVVAVSASGRTAYVLGALETARTAGALTVCVVSVRESALARAAEHEIAVVVGPEVIAGSTRLKAGTAQKLVLNMISTLVMVRLGKTFGDLMVDVVAANAKLNARVARIVRYATGADERQAGEALRAADGDAKVAIVSILAGVDADTARARLEAGGGAVRGALDR